MIKILWLLESKINSDFINEISDELELKIQISSSFEKETIYDVIILENLAIISHLSEIQKNSILIYVLDEKNNIFDHQNIYVNYYIRNVSLYEDLYQAFLKSKDFLLKKINTISLKSGKINYHIIKNNILYIESFRNYIVIHTSISDYTLRYTLKKIHKKLLQKMYDTCIMKEQIKKKSVEGRKGLWTIAVEVRSKTKAISVMMDSCTHSVFPLMPEDSIFCGFVFLVP